MRTTEVLVVGGGSVGLATAVFLSHHGVRTLLVERDEGPRSHPRATGIGVRTVEMLRETGLAGAVDAVALDWSAGALGKARARTLADLAETAPPAPAVPRQAPYSPAALRGPCPQNRLDPVLLAAARENGATVSYGTGLVSFTQDEEGVTAVLSTGERVRARYLVAADGVRSEVRAALGIGLTGPGALTEPGQNILFRADLRELVRGRHFVACEITDPAAPGMLITIDGEKEWVFLTGLDREPAPALIRAATGVPDLDVEILSTLVWRVRAQVAERFAQGRVFLAGDAAHAVPPLGAFGLNTGVADGHNLAWKLALVLRGEAGPALLGTYDAERRPVASLTMEQALVRMSDPALHWGHGPAAAEARAAAGALNAPVVHLGQRYVSAAVIDPRPELPSAEDVVACLDGSPGSRMPHAWVSEGVSTLDLVRSRFTVFIRRPGGDRDEAGGAAWPAEAARLGLNAHAVDLAEIPPGGALLVRPDGYVAWRAEGGPERLGGVLDRLLARGRDG
ncbi:FAD-dependent oxidoreductase [Microbispora sp. H10885]|uniref:FAD-dependent oxidoreductase n=1 Tax=Microbispora sp. H10885 TaxID=2729110 RepID=UPI001600D159|nr:FAD-dependent oxidoreductase [Microbispora sp. H10885]